MNSATTKQFWKCFDALPVSVQRLAAEAFEGTITDLFWPKRR